MKILLVLVISILSISTASLDKRLTAPTINCWDVGYNAGNLLVKFLKEGERDSVNGVLQFWEKECGYSEAFFRISTILKIKDGKLNKTEINRFDSSTIYYMYDYKNRIKDIKENPKTFKSINEWYRYPQAQNFDSLTRQVASSIEVSELSTDNEKILIHLYSNRFDEFESLISKESNETIPSLYNAELEKIEDMNLFSMGFISGIWIPIGPVSTIGNHPVIGFYLGGGNKFIFDINLSFRFLKSKNRYTVFSQDSLMETDHFFGGYIGIDLSYLLYANSNYRVHLLSGYAFDGWDAINKNEDEGIDNKGIWSSFGNINFGLGYHYFYTAAGNFGIECKYNLVNYNNGRGTDLSGNTVSLLIKWGILGNVRKQNAYKYYGLKR